MNVFGVPLFLGNLHRVIIWNHKKSIKIINPDQRSDLDPTRNHPKPNPSIPFHIYPVPVLCPQNVAWQLNELMVDPWWHLSRHARSTAVDGRFHRENLLNPLFQNGNWGSIFKDLFKDLPVLKNINHGDPLGMGKVPCEKMFKGSYCHGGRSWICLSSKGAAWFPFREAERKADEKLPFEDKLQTFYQMAPRICGKPNAINIPSPQSW